MLTHTFPLTTFKSLFDGLGRLAFLPAVLLARRASNPNRPAAKRAPLMVYPRLAGSAREIPMPDFEPIMRLGSLRTQGSGFPGDSWVTLELRIAKRADELAKSTKIDTALNLHCWLLAEREILGWHVDDRRR